MFPRGLPGFALLLLRLSVAVAVLFDCYVHRQQLPGWIQIAAVLLAFALSAGYLTPIAAMTSLAFHLLVWSELGLGSTALAVIICLDAIAIALLGPGEYSVDSYRFGRRVVVLTPPP
jgi:hypothetical protein